jgi:hypothetical protein
MQQLSDSRAQNMPLLQQLHAAVLLGQQQFTAVQTESQCFWSALTVCKTTVQQHCQFLSVLHSVVCQLMSDADSDLFAAASAVGRAQRVLAARCSTTEGGWPTYAEEAMQSLVSSVASLYSRAAFYAVAISQAMGPCLVQCSVLLQQSALLSVSALNADGLQALSQSFVAAAEQDKAASKACVEQLLTLMQHSTRFHRDAVSSTACDDCFASVIASLQDHRTAFQGFASNVQLQSYLLL